MPFEPKIRKARFAYTGYTPQQMIEVGNGLIHGGIVRRIQSGLNVYDTPAKPLAPQYIKRKQRAGKGSLRDWTFSGDTLRSLHVLVAGANKAILGFSDFMANRRAVINNRRDRQFGVSNSDRRVLLDLFRLQPPSVKAIEVK